MFEKRGFTLIELRVVIAVIAILMARQVQMVQDVNAYSSKG
jgi:prepilin-type N-terminal cleavage/methylation domain-containing protein